MSDETTPQDDAAMSPASTGSVEDRITAYLCNGGLFNPEMAIHDRVRDLLMNARDEINRLRLTDAEREAIERGYCALMGVEDMSAECTRWDAEAAATLRGLLERLK